MKFSVRSYTSKGADVQRSVVVATFTADGRIGAEFDWWFGNASPSAVVDGATYEMPAYAELNQDSSSQTPVPTARLTVFQRGDGTVMAVRCTALNHEQERRVLESIHWR